MRCAQRAGELGRLALQQQAHVLDRFGVNLRGGQILDARPQAALDVELQTGPRMIARQVDFAGGNQKAAMDQIDDAVGKIGREVRAVVSGAVLAQLARHVHPRIALGGELDVGIAFCRRAAECCSAASSA